MFVSCLRVLSVVDRYCSLARRWLMAVGTLVLQYRELRLRVLWNQTGNDKAPAVVEARLDCALTATALLTATVEGRTSAVVGGGAGSEALQWWSWRVRCDGEVEVREMALARSLATGRGLCAQPRRHFLTSQEPIVCATPACMQPGARRTESGGPPSSFGGRVPRAVYSPVCVTLR